MPGSGLVCPSFFVLFCFCYFVPLLGSNSSLNQKKSMG